MSTSNADSKSDAAERKIPGRTLVREVLMTQLVFAAVVGVIALACVWSVANWVMRDNLEDWSSRWMGELEGLGVGLYVSGADDSFAALGNYIQRFPEMVYVRYYDADGAVLYVESRTEDVAYPQLGRIALDGLVTTAHDSPAHQVDESQSPLLRISRAIVTESMVTLDLFTTDDISNMRTHATVVGFVELGLDYSLYDQELVDGMLLGSGFVLLAFVILVAAGRVILRKGVQPLADVQQPIQMLAEGNLDIELPDAKHNEIAAITNALYDAASKIRERDTRLNRLANYDELTGLANRRHFLEQLGEQLTNKAAGALLFIDLDRFKHINDTVGHQAGDNVLRQVGERIKSAVRDSDLIARAGGDEFLVFVPGINRNRTEEIGSELLRGLREFPLVHEDTNLNVACSVGATMIAADNAFTADELISQADVACRKAKEDGRNRLHIYEVAEGELDIIRSDIGWRQILEDAIKNDSFELYYQPIQRVSTRSVSSFEALIRLPHEGEVRLPNAFLSSAARFGLMHDIDYWVVDRAISDLAVARKTRPHLSFSINVTGSTIGEDGFAAYVADCLQCHGVNGKALNFEITEQVAVGATSKAMAQIEALVATGCSFAMDDFGTGYSSLGYLQRLPVKYIKIDGAFIHKLAENKVDQTIVRAIAKIAKEMGKETVAEFVTDERVFDLIDEIGIDYAQGFYIGIPLPLTEALELADNAKVVSFRTAS